MNIYLFLYSMYPAKASIHKTKLDQLLKGKRVQISKGDVPVHLIFKKLKDYNKHVKAFANDKSHRIHLDELHDVQDHEGGSLLGRINHAFHKVNRAFRKIGKDKTIKEIGHTVVPVLKKIGKTALPIVSQAVGDAVNEGVSAYTGNPIAGKIAGNMASNGTNQLGNKVIGTGFLDVIKKEAKKQIQNKAKKIAQKGVNYVIDKATGGSINITDDPEQSYGLGGSRLINSTFNNQPISIHERMAIVRSHRKKKVGGSFAVL